MLTVSRYHDITCGHRVVGHEGKCRYLHGHNYRFHFTLAGRKDAVGRVIDFGIIKSTLCMWLEKNWDHRFLAWCDDHIIQGVAVDLIPYGNVADSFVFVPFNPTAENMAEHFVTVVAPALLAQTGAELISLTIDETAKCSATYCLEKHA